MTFFLPQPLCEQRQFHITTSLRSGARLITFSQPKVCPVRSLRIFTYAPRSQPQERLLSPRSRWSPAMTRLVIPQAAQMQCHVSRPRVNPAGLMAFQLPYVMPLRLMRAGMVVSPWFNIGALTQKAVGDFGFKLRVREFFR